MAQRSLFPDFGNVFGSHASGRREIVSFNAGKMHTASTTNGTFLVSPDTTKGKLRLYRGEDQLIHFQWQDRQTGASQEDLIIFPDEATFTQVDTGRSHDRVYLLQYKNSERRFFYWMQNKDSSRDAEVSKKLNDAMNNPRSSHAEGGGHAGRGGDGSLDQNAIMQMLGAMSGSEHGANSRRGNAAGTGGQSSLQMSELQNILQQMGLPPQSAISSPATSAVSASSPGSQSGAASSVAATTASTQDHDVTGMEVDEMSEEDLLRLAIEESMRDVNAPSTQTQQGNSENGGSNSQNETSGSNQPN